jgi:hypothetical protein
VRRVLLVFKHRLLTGWFRRGTTGQLSQTALLRHGNALVMLRIT